MKVKLHPGQMKVVSSPARFKVVVAGRRWGKSVLARMWLLHLASRNPGTYWIVSPTFAMGKDIHWKQGILNEIPDRIVRKRNEADLEVTLINGSSIQLKSAEHPDRLRGVKLRGLVIDEIASIRNWDWLWEEVLRPTLTDYAAPAMFISTPKGFNHFYDLYQMGLSSSDKKDTSYESFKFTSYDNPHIPASEIDAAKVEMTEDAFYQEYMSDFRKFVGLVYKDFSIERNVVKPFPVPSSWRIYRSMDFGSNNPTVCLWTAVDDDGNIWVIDEHYETGQTIDYHAGIINARSHGKRIVATYGDPTGAQWLNEFSRRGVYITKANKDTGTTRGSWILFGINKISELLKVKQGHFVDGQMSDKVTGMPSLFVFNNCVNTIREFETYRWKDKSAQAEQDLNEPETPEKANDHAMDALRYMVVSFKGIVTSVPNYQWKEKQWKIGSN